MERFTCQNSSTLVPNHLLYSTSYLLAEPRLQLTFKQIQ